LQPVLLSLSMVATLSLKESELTVKESEFELTV
jgi:hypothetical protein